MVQKKITSPSTTNVHPCLFVMACTVNLFRSFVSILYRGTCCLPGSQFVHLHGLAQSLGLRLGDFVITEAQEERRREEEVVEGRQVSGGVGERGSTADDGVEVDEEMPANISNEGLLNHVEEQTGLKEGENLRKDQEETENETVGYQGAAAELELIGEVREASKTSRGKYNVEKILAKKKIGGKSCYLVKWSGFEEKDSTWEPAKALAGNKWLQKLCRKFNEDQRKMAVGQGEVNWEASKKAKTMAKKRSLNETEDADEPLPKLKQRRKTMPGGVQDGWVVLPDVGARETLIVTEKVRLE